MISTCKKHGRQDPSLWILVLSYFASRGESCREEIAETLANIDRHNLLPPLLVVQILGQSGSASLSVVKGYVAGAWVPPAGDHLLTPSPPTATLPDACSRSASTLTRMNG